MTFSFLCAAAAIGAVQVQTPVTAQPASARIPQAAQELEIVEANGAYSIQAKLPPVVSKTAVRKARAISIRVGSAVQLDETVFGTGMEIDHASEH